MIIDVHTHVSRLPNTKFADDIKKNLSFLIEEMEKNNVDRSLVIAGFRDETVLRPKTEDLINLASEYKQLDVIGSVDVLTYDDSYLENLEFWLANKKIVGVKIYTGYQHVYPNDERCTRIYELCTKYNRPVVLHTGDTLAGAVANPKLKYAHPLNVDDIAVDFSDLKIVIAHMGNPWLVDCAEVLYKNPNVYADISGLVVGETLETPYGKMMIERVRELIDYVGENKLMYGTDWPLCPMDSYLNFVDKLGLSENDKEILFSKNAIKVFGLN